MLRKRAGHALQNLVRVGPHAAAPRCPACAQLPRRSPAVVVHVRGKKTRTTVSLADLPQGVVQADPLPDLEEKSSAPTYPTVVLQARRNMDKFDNCVLLTRVGGFYELYFEHADEYAPLLNLKLASKKTSAGPVAMVNIS